MLASMSWNARIPIANIQKVFRNKTFVVIKIMNYETRLGASAKKSGENFGL